MTHKLLPRLYYAIQLAYIDFMLTQLPEYNLGRRSSETDSYQTIHYRSPDSSSGWKTISFSRATKDMQRIALRIHELKVERKKLISIWKENFKGTYKEDLAQIKLRRIETLLDTDFFNKAEGQALPYNENETYQEDEYDYRSRVERDVSKVLKSLGLEFKYEVFLPNVNKTTDFLIHIPALNACIALEVWGRMGDPDYRLHNISQMNTLLESGYQLNSNYAILMGDINKAPSTDEIILQISFCIANLINERIKPLPR